MNTNIPNPLPDDPTYFQVLIDSRIKDSSSVHLTFTANRMSRTATPIQNITWLTGGGTNFDDWNNPVMQIVNDISGVKHGANFNDTYDILLDDLPKDPSGTYSVLKIPFLNPNDSSESLAGSGHLTITLNSPAVMKINSSGQTGGFAFALPSPDPNGAGGNTHWDFVEFNCATPANNSKSVCFCDTTNVDFFSLGIAIKGRTSTGTLETFGLDLSGKSPVNSLVSALSSLSAEYAAGLVNPSGNFLRFLAPDLSFKDNATALDTAITDGFNYYKTTPLSFKVGSTSYEATSDGNTLTFTKPTSFTVAKPTTMEVIASTGSLKTDKTADINNALKYIDAALNRGVFADTSSWATPSNWYPSNVKSNEYSKTLHEHFLGYGTAAGSACYGFSYDDVPGPPLVTSAPAIATCTSMTLAITDQ